MITKKSNCSEYSNIAYKKNTDKQLYLMISNFGFYNYKQMGGVNMDRNTFMKLVNDNDCFEFVIGYRDDLDYYIGSEVDKPKEN